MVQADDYKTLSAGPFVGMINPVAEDDLTFAEIHAINMGEVMRQLSEALLTDAQNQVFRQRVHAWQHDPERLRVVPSST